MLAKNLEQSWAMLVKKIIIWRCGDDGKMKDEDLFVQSWLYVHMIYELLRWFMHQGTDHSKIYIIHHIVKFVFTAQVLVTSDEILFGQIFGLILHTHCRRPARLTEVTSIFFSHPWWASALGFSRWVFNVFLSVVFSTLAAPGSTSFQAVQRSSAVQFGCPRLAWDAHKDCPGCENEICSWTMSLSSSLWTAEYTIPHWNCIN